MVQFQKTQKFQQIPPPPKKNNNNKSQLLSSSKTHTQIPTNLVSPKKNFSFKRKLVQNWFSFNAFTIENPFGGTNIPELSIVRDFQARKGSKGLRSPKVSGGRPHVVGWCRTKNAVLKGSSIIFTHRPENTKSSQICHVFYTYIPYVCTIQRRREKAVPGSQKQPCILRFARTLW